MVGLALVREAISVGLAVTYSGDRLLLRGPRRAEPVALKLVAQKPAVLAALQWLNSPDTDHASEADWREFFEERAAIRQFEGQYQAGIAERLAWAELIEHWCKSHPQPLRPEVCAACDDLLGAAVLDLPGAARIHWDRDGGYRCLIAYGLKRKRRAVTALAALGLTPPQGWEP